MSEIRNSLGFTVEKPWANGRCTGPIAESWREAALTTSQKVRNAWASYTERERGAGRIESSELKARVAEYGERVEQLPGIPMAGSPEQYTDIAERSIGTLKSAKSLLPELGVTGATVGGPSGKNGYATAFIVGGVLVAGYYLMRGDG